MASPRVLLRNDWPLWLPALFSSGTLLKILTGSVNKRLEALGSVWTGGGTEGGRGISDELLEELLESESSSLPVASAISFRT